ncbi:hypothetical protein HEP86_39565 [Streptomyces sp. RPA4-5]|nr:hypothetical protein HEP86_39565 [Streptomyces sp. RPA4-5]
MPGGGHRAHLRATPCFTSDLQHLTPAQRRRFRRVVLGSFVPDMRTGLFRLGLREAREFAESWRGDAGTHSASQGAQRASSP